ncbi:hypothetical protein [Motilibacter deserti]|uniref:Uncharacterized protein n=1 Tax=Motilibacter deserti TaxID=2714956 RepID=A0ABX0GUR3_9ACTN|nr:hypothetical protein [Motilibacter deserti]NHC14258.1 hypothetical protein [Motilibacter deserti]
MSGVQRHRSSTAARILSAAFTTTLVLAPAPAVAVAAPGPGPACAAPTPTYERPAKVPEVSGRVLLTEADLRGGWQARQWPGRLGAMNGGEGGLQRAGVLQAVRERSSVGAQRVSAAPAWTLYQDVWRLDPSSAAAGWAGVRQQALCNGPTSGRSWNVRAEQVDDESAVVVLEAAPARALGSRTYWSTSWQLVARAGDLVTHVRLELTAVPAELRAIDRAAVAAALRGTVTTRLAGAAPAPLQVYANPARQAPPASATLRPADFGTGWSRVPDGGWTGFSGGVSAFGRSGPCSPETDIAIAGLRTESYRGPGEAPRSLATWESVFRLFPGSGPRYMAQVRRNIRAGCASVQEMVPSAQLRGIGDDALLLSAAKGVSGQTHQLVVRRGDTVAIVGLSPAARKRSTVWKTGLLRAMAQRLADG